METKNITITGHGWKNLETEGSLEFTSGDEYTISIFGNGQGQVCISDSTPTNDFIGHPVAENTNFTFTYGGTDIWVRPGHFTSKATIVIS